jgi:protein-tyrosine phosphatase
VVISVLFVCTGNICRSPTAEGVFRELIARKELVDRIDVASAGTHGWHVGNPPDPRSIEAAALRGIDISTQRSRQFRPGDFGLHDYVLAMDTENDRFLRPLYQDGVRARLVKFLEFAPQLGQTDVPDPYYGAGNGFEIVLDMIETASDGLLADIRNHHELQDT